MKQSFKYGKLVQDKSDLATVKKPQLSDYSCGFSYIRKVFGFLTTDKNVDRMRKEGKV